MGRGKEQEKCFTLEGAPRRASTQELEPEQEQTVCQKPVYTTSAGQMERETLPVNIAKTRFSTNIHFVSSLSPLGSNWNSLFHTMNIYFCLLLSQCSLSDVRVAQQHQNVSFPMLWGIHRPGYQNSLPSWTVPQSIPTPTQHCSRGFHHPVNQKRKVPSNMKWRKIHLLPRRKCRGQLKAEP